MVELGRFCERIVCESRKIGISCIEIFLQYLPTHGTRSSFFAEVPVFANIGGAII